MGEIRQFTGPRLCGHCGVVVKMEIVANHSIGHNVVPGDWMEDGPSEGIVYRIILCPNCEGASMEKADWNAGPEGFGYEEEQCQTLYPAAASAPPGLPKDLVRIFESSLKVRNVDADSYVTKIRKLLEAVCKRCDAKGGNLEQLIESLVKAGKIPADLARVAHNLRLFGNHGAHASIDEVPKEVVPVVEKLCDALLGYLYTMPLLVAEADGFLKKLNAAKKASRGTNT